jgi:hypothetical protein
MHDGGEADIVDICRQSVVAQSVCIE